MCERKSGTETMEKYSVLMAVYKKDNPEYFAIALDSMINQTVPPDEIVIVKDGPITEELQAIIDERRNGKIVIHEVALENNLGLGLALQNGIMACRNELIARMDADDFSMPERCEKQLHEFEENRSLDIVGCQAIEFIGTTNNVVGVRKVPLDNEEIYKFAKMRDPFNHPSVMYRKSKVLACGNYRHRPGDEDTDLWIRMLQNRAVCKNLDESIFFFRFDEKTYQRRKSWTNTKTLIGIRYDAWRGGFNSLGEFLVVLGAQMGVYIMPEWFEKMLYQKVLRSH